VVPIAMGAEARDALQANSYRPEWREYPIEHSVSMDEIADIGRWLQQRLA